MKCLHCGKTEREHNAKTRACPVGRKHRTMGHTSWHHTHRFIAEDVPGVTVDQLREKVRAIPELQAAIERSPAGVMASDGSQQ